MYEYDKLGRAVDWVRGIIGYFDKFRNCPRRPGLKPTTHRNISNFLHRHFLPFPHRTNHRLPGESKRAIAGVGSSSSSCVAVAGEVDYGVGGDRIEAISGGLDRQVEVPAQDETHQIL